MIYADNAATTQLDPAAFEAMKPYLLYEYGNPSQPYSFSRKPKRALKEAAEKIAKCINADPNEIFFTSGGTESDNWAIKGMLKYGDNRAIITDEIEHHAVINACKSVERLGYPIAYLPVDVTGTVAPETLKRFITSKPKLVSVMLVNNEIGTIQPVKQLAEIAHANGALFHTDAVQAVGHISVDVKELGVDLLSASAHKFNGPRGVGFLYIKQGTEIEPLMNGGAQERELRAGTENVAAIVGMAMALENNCSHLQENMKHTAHLVETFLSKLNVPYYRNGNPECSLPGIVSLSFEHVTGESLLHILDLKGIIISTGSACDSINQQVSHVIRAIKTPENFANGTIRISFGKDNVEQDSIVIAEKIVAFIRKLNKIV